MATRRYATAGRPKDRSTGARVLAAADAFVRSGRFHAATVEELAEQAGVARATVFAQFGSRLGILQALHDRCANSPESEALRRALALSDPVERLDAATVAGCHSWEEWGALHLHLRAIVTLEPDVRPLVESQRKFHHDALEAIARDLGRLDLLRDGLTAQRAAAALRVLTGLEAFVELRQRGGLSLNQTVRTMRELNHTLLKA